jgi:hypothetical protein
MLYLPSLLHLSLLNLPPTFIPAPVVLPPAHPNFPATKGALRRLNGKQTDCRSDPPEPLSSLVAGVNLTVAIPVTQEAIDELRALIDTPREDALRWVSEDFAVVANDIYTVLGSPKLEVLSG